MAWAGWGKSIGARRVAHIVAASCVALSVGVVVVQTGPAAAASGFVAASSPKRVLDTRSGEATSDGQMQGIGMRAAGTTLSIPIRGRAEVGSDAAAVVVNVTVTQPQDRGFA